MSLPSHRSQLSSFSLLISTTRASRASRARNRNTNSVFRDLFAARLGMLFRVCNWNSRKLVGETGRIKVLFSLKQQLREESFNFKPWQGTDKRNIGIRVCRCLASFAVNLQLRVRTHRSFRSPFIDHTVHSDILKVANPGVIEKYPITS